MSLEELRGILLTEREAGKVTSLPHHLFEQTHEEIMELQAQVYATEDPFSPESQMLIEKVASIRVTIEEVFSLRSSKIVSLAQSHADGSFIDREELKMLHPDELAMFHQIVEAIRVCRSVLVEQKEKVTQPSSFLSASSPSQNASVQDHMPVPSEQILSSERELSSPVPSSPPSSLLSSSSSLASERGTADHSYTSESLQADDLRDEMDSPPSNLDNGGERKESFSSLPSSPSPSLSEQRETAESKYMVPEEQDNTDPISGSKAYSLVLVLADMDPFMGVDGYVYEIRDGDIITLPRKNADVLAERNIVLNIKAS